MANTVNDVMNVIASPDYGIKNIAGTNQEILAILQGTHNSKNNIYNIVDDVRNLLQKLVDSNNNKNKTVEIDSNTSAKINHKHIQDILDETKGIRKAIDNLAKILLKQVRSVTPTIAKLSDKASDKVAKAMVENINKQNNGSGLTSIIDAFSKLKNISLKDIIVGKQKIKLITKIFKNAKEDLKIDEKDLNSIIKLINSAPEMMKSLSRVGWRINRIIRNNIIGKLSDILIGKKSILSLSILLNKNKKKFDDANKSAKNITSIVGNLFASTILLTALSITGAPALLGATLLEKTIDKLIPTVKKLSKSNKYMGVAAKSALSLTVVTGLMAVSSLFLATVAVSGVPALLGSILMLGIVKITTLTFKMLNKSNKHILKGSIAMVIMSTSLILFGVALKKIVDATKGVSLKQVGIIALTTAMLGGTIALLGIPAVAIFIAIGSLALGVMSSALRPFTKTLYTISKTSEKLNFKQIALINKSMKSLALGVAGISLLSVPIFVGSKTLNRLSKSLHSFAKSLKEISSIGSLPNKQIYQVLNAMKSIGDFFKDNKLKKKSIKNARRYKRMLRPFTIAAQHISKLKEIGVIPMKLVYQTLNAMSAIANYFKENPIRRKAIRQARRYKKMLRPFGNTIKQLVKLKELGVLPMKLVYQTLNTMKEIANYYMENPIRRKAIRQARRYKKMLRPFGNTIKQLVKLKELGVLPMKLVYQTLNAMKEIANYYMENPIRRKAIRQAKRYKDMLKPFGNTIKQLVKLKELGVLPTKLVYQTLDTMKSIANYFMENPIKKKAIKQAKRYKKMLSPFGNTIKYLSKLKELGSIPMKLVHQALNAISAIADFYREQDIQSFEGIDAKNSAITISGIISSFGKSVGSLNALKDIKNIPINAINNIIEAANNISSFYNTTVLSDNVDEKSKITEFIVNKFANVVMNIQDKFANIKTIDYNIVSTATNAFTSIFKYYTQNKFIVSKKKIEIMGNAIKRFAENAKFLKDNIQGFTKSEYTNVKFAVKSIKHIIKLLKSNISTEKVQKNMMTLKEITSALSSVSSINSENISSIGNAISNTLSGVSSSVDMEKLQAVTNMFNAFNGINKSESIINKFTESVKEFTETCKNLIDAMNSNSDAISNIENSGDKSIISEIRENNIIEKGYGDNPINTSGIRISNVDEIAKTIAEKINGALSVDVPDTQVQLLINGIGGNEWTITRY